MVGNTDLLNRSRHITPPGVPEHDHNPKVCVLISAPVESDHFRFILTMYCLYCTYLPTYAVPLNGTN